MKFKFKYVYPKSRSFILLTLILFLCQQSYAQSEELQQLTDKRDSTLARISPLRHKIDSLYASADPGSTLQFELDALRKQLDTLQNSKAIQKSRQPLNEINNVDEKMKSKLGIIEQKVNQRIAALKPNGFESVPGLPNVPQVKLPGVDIGNTNLTDNIPKNILPKDVVSKDVLPGNIGTNLSQQLPDVEGKVQSVMNQPLEKVGQLKEIDALKQVQGKAGEVTEVAQEINAYARDIKSIASGDPASLEQLSTTVENKLTGLEEVKALQEGLEPAGDYTAMMQKWASDPEVAKELALNKSKEYAVNHFQGHENELKEAMGKLDKAKEKYQKFGHDVNVFAPSRNPLKSRPFIERLLPGITMQIQSPGNFWLDLWPTIGYRWHPRFITGLGWVERVSYDFKNWNFVASDRTYGPRTYAEFMVKNDFSLRAESELIHARVTSPYLLNQPDPPQTSWTWSHFAGIKKSFKITNYLKGNVQTLYNIYNPLQRSPYRGRMMVRIGFEVPLTVNKMRTGN